MVLFWIKPKTVLRRTFISILASAAFWLTSPIVSAQTDIPDYSELSATELQTLVDQGDMHAVFTQGYNIIFDETANVRADADFSKAKTLLETAHAMGHDSANSILMLYYQGEFGQEPDFDKLESILLTSAERGSAVAKINYAHRFIQSEETEKSDRAFQYLNDAAADEVVREMAYPFLIEILYGAGSGTHTNQPLARKTAVECSELWPEDAFCNYILARDFQNGWGGEVNLAKSDFHFVNAAEAGDPRAQWQVGMNYLNGERVEANEKTAFGWIKKAAEQDYLNGLISYAVMNALGQGTEIDSAAAFKAYEAAASLGSGHAIRGLGSMYCSGEAPKTDKDLCGAALILGYEMGDMQAAALLDHFFQVTDQTKLEALKKRTTLHRATLIDRYNIRL